MGLRFVFQLTFAAHAVFASATVLATGHFPVPDWQVVQNDRTEALRQELLPWVFDDAVADGPRSNGLLVISGGKIVVEAYRDAAGFTAQTRHPIWSVSKSLLHGLVGAALQDGRIDLNQTVAHYVPASGLDRITINNLLHMETCLAWNEGYEGNRLVDSSVLAMLYGDGRSDMSSFAWNRELECEPGSTWKYSTGVTQILAAVLRQVYGIPSEEFPWTALFDPIGASGITFEQDSAGHLVGGSYGRATLRDLGRFGLLYINDGMWNGTRILPEGWFLNAATPAPSYSEEIQHGEGGGWNYGALWWSNTSRQDLPSGYSALPSDVIVAMGHWGQSVTVIPSLDLVVVRTGNDRGQNFNLPRLITTVVSWSRGSDGEKQFAAMLAPLAARSLPISMRAKAESRWFDMPGLSATFSSHELCSCLFVSQLPEAYCRVYASQSPELSTPYINWSDKSVTAAARFLSWRGQGPWKRRAEWISEREGCR